MKAAVRENKSMVATTGTVNACTQGAVQEPVPSTSAGIECQALGRMHFNRLRKMKMLKVPLYVAILILTGFFQQSSLTRNYFLGDPTTSKATTSTSSTRNVTEKTTTTTNRHLDIQTTAVPPSTSSTKGPTYTGTSTAFDVPTPLPADSHAVPTKTTHPSASPTGSPTMSPTATNTTGPPTSGQRLDQRKAQQVPLLLTRQVLPLAVPLWPQLLVQVQVLPQLLPQLLRVGPPVQTQRHPQPSLKRNHHHLQHPSLTFATTMTMDVEFWNPTKKTCHWQHFDKNVSIGCPITALGFLWKKRHTLPKSTNVPNKLLPEPMLLQWTRTFIGKTQSPKVATSSSVI